MAPLGSSNPRHMTYMDWTTHKATEVKGWLQDYITAVKLGQVRAATCLH